LLRLTFRYRVAGFPVRPGLPLGARQRQVSAAQPPLRDNQIFFRADSLPRNLLEFVIVDL